MGDTHRRVGGVHALTAVAAGRHGVEADFFGIDHQFHIFHFGKHGHSHGRGVNAAGLLRFRHALHAVHAAFVLQVAVGILSGDFEDDFLEAAEFRLA